MIWWRHQFGEKRRNEKNFISLELITNWVIGPVVVVVKEGRQRVINMLMNKWMNEWLCCCCWSDGNDWHTRTTTTSSAVHSSSFVKLVANFSFFSPVSISPIMPPFIFHHHRRCTAIFLCAACFAAAAATLPSSSSFSVFVFFGKDSLVA